MIQKENEQDEGKTLEFRLYNENFRRSLIEPSSVAQFLRDFGDGVLERIRIEDNEKYLSTCTNSRGRNYFLSQYLSITSSELEPWETKDGRLPVEVRLGAYAGGNSYAILAKGYGKTTSEAWKRLVKVLLGERK